MLCGNKNNKKATIWMNIKNIILDKVRHEKVHTVWLCLFELQEEAELIYSKEIRMVTPFG